MHRAYVDTSMGQIHYFVSGEGEPVLLLHQTPYSADEYIDMMHILGKSVCAIAMDTLGYGNSDKPPQECSVEDYARSITEFLDALGIVQTNIVGHHTGATLAVEVAATYPSRVKKVVLSGLAVYSQEEQNTIPKRFFQPMDIDYQGEFLMSLWNSRKSSAPYLSIDMRYRRLLAELNAGTRFHDAHYADLRYEKIPKLSKIKSPILIVYGTGDMFFGQLGKVRNLIPNGKALTIETQGNGIMYEKPLEVAKLILDFLESPNRTHE